MALVNRILIATDFSTCSQRALEYGAAMAAQFKARTVVAHIYAPPVIIVPETVIPMSPAGMQAMLDRLTAGLDAAAATVKQLGAGEVETALAEGEPWLEIVRLARERGCDLVILGTHGRGAIGHFFLGSVAEKVVRKAECPVLVVGQPR